MPDKGGRIPRLSRRSSDDVVGRIEYLAFRLAADLYAVSIERIGEILRIPPLAPVPRAPAHVMGIVGVRGRVLTVLDVRERLGLQRQPVTRHARILVLPVGNGESVGMYVDEVLQVFRIAETQIEPAARGLGGDVGEHVVGIVRLRQDLVLVIRLDPLLEA